MKIRLLILCLVLSSQVLAQTIDVEFGILSIEEIDMTSYEKDKDAKAVVLFDIGKSVFFDADGGFDIRFTRHKRIKIFDKNASQYAEVSIPYYVDGSGKAEKVKSIQAITINTQGGIITQKIVEPSTIYEERINDRWFNKKFVFPDVQDGSILDLKYVLETPFHFNLPDWYFQDKIPTLYSEYEISMIPFYEYIFIAQGISRFDYRNSVVAKKERSWGEIAMAQGVNVGSGVLFHDYVHTYILKDVPAFKDESYITSINDYIIKMDFQLAKFYRPEGGTNEVMSTWEKLNEFLLKNSDFGKYLKSSSRIAKKVLEDELLLVGLNQNEKAEKVIEYVKNSFVWNEYYSKYASQSAKSFFNEKKGNVADINLFMIALLKEAGVEVEPLIISTRGHGKIPADYPFNKFTNYVIALVNTNSSFLADGTEELLAYDMIPTRALNDMGLIVNNAKEPQWVSVQSGVASLEKNTLSLAIDTLTLDVKTHVSIQSTFYESFSNKQSFKDDTLKIKAYYSDKIGAIKKTKTIGYQNASTPYTMAFEANYETEKLDNIIVIKPFLDLPMSKNHLTQKSRTYPVDFVYISNYQFESTLEIPKGFTLKTPPDSYKLDNGLVEINLTYTVADRTFVATGNYNFKKSVYAASDYPKIKSYFGKIIKYFNQPIVLEANE